MRSLFVSSAIASLALAVAAHDVPSKQLRQVLEARQDPIDPAAPPPVTLLPPPDASTVLDDSATLAVDTDPSASVASTPVGSASVPSVSASSLPPTTYTFTLAATNPTAVPLASITANEASAATLPLDTTPVPGARPTFLPGAPPLPSHAILVGAYPAMDKVPATDSPEVKGWISDVANSGVSIPDFTPTVAGGCLSNPTIATDPSRCWWTCTGCTGQKDITQCPKPLSWGLTYDDGPGYYTSNLLQYLDEKALKSTFFVVGSRALQFPDILQAQYMGQHQIAVHTWSHQPLTTLTNEQIIAELGWTKKVIKDVLGVTPNMMRPPFGDIDNRVRAISLAMGLTPVIWTRTSPTSTFDTDDFNIHNGVTPVQKVLQNWQNILGSASSLDHGFIVLEHDLFQESVDVATGYILPDALAHNPPFNIQPVISCLGHALSDGYIETNNNKTNPPPNLGAPGVGVGGDATKSDAGRQYHPLVTTTLIVGVSGFAVGLFAVLRF